MVQLATKAALGSIMQTVGVPQASSTWRSTKGAFENASADRKEEGIDNRRRGRPLAHPTRVQVLTAELQVVAMLLPSHQLSLHKVTVRKGNLDPGGSDCS